MNPQTQLNQVAALISSMAHPLRLKIIVLLGESGELNVFGIRKQLQAQQSLVSQYLASMKRQGSISSVRAGQHRVYSLVDSALADELIRLINR